MKRLTVSTKKMNTYFVLCFCIVVVCGSTLPDAGPCTDLSGTWRNELGSNMTVVRYENSLKITGTYSTAVESSRGAASVTSNVTGLVQPVEGGSLVAFNVLWNNGASLTAWVGQCLVCDGQEQLYTTWVLRSLFPAKKRWMSTRINQDTFYRVQGAPTSPPLPEPNHEGENDPAVVGAWSAESGDAILLSSAIKDLKLLNGLHVPSVAEGDLLFGQFDGNETYTAFGFVAASDDKIHGWAGHVYNPEDPAAAIETSQLSHEFSERCNNPRKDTDFAMNYYAKSRDGQDSE